MDFLTIDVGTILFTLINTGLIFLAFKLILFKRVDAILEQRQQEVADTYQSAEDARASANSEKEKYAQAIANAKEEASGILSRAEKQAQKQSESLLEKARAEAQAVREKANRETEREKILARQALQGEISGLAVELAQKMIEKEIAPEDHARLIDDFLKELGDAS
ncbi:MAG: F0F1 ATP synthase subunit B [Oscillospiraceae bacterium]|nr:F0F1 ATP synthase subunit B [Oscillospiraceae bacterium]